MLLSICQFLVSPINITAMIKKGLKRVFDTFQSADIQLNQHGTLRSDFSVLVEDQSVMNMAAAAQRLREIDAQSPNAPDDTFEQIVARVRPRWVQSPRQMVDFEKYLAENEIDLYNRYKDSISTTEDAAASAAADASSSPSSPE